MRKIVSRVIGAPLAGSRLPSASKYATLPWRAISSTAPGILFCSISLPSHFVTRSSRSDDSPTVSGLTRGKSWAAATPGATPITTTIINATKRCFMIPPARRLGRHHSRSSRGRFDPPPCRPARRHRMSEIRDGMRIEWHVPITMDDGIVLRADVYRPIADGRCPVILSHGVYAKGLAYQQGYPMQWQKMVLDHPEILEGSTNKYQAWEVTDPERWVPHGYAIVRVDSRGSGWSPGYLDPLCPREDDDLAACIEWAGTQPWSNGKVGLLGISYYAVNQWLVAQMQPPHLTAMCPWQGYQDFYRDCNRHGGILNTFMPEWFPVQVMSVQYGNGSTGVNPNSGELIVAGEPLSDEELARNRSDLPNELRQRELDDQWYRD